MTTRARPRPPTPEQIVDAAAALTAQRGLDGWSLRDLATVLNTWHNNITHHVGDREALLRLIVGRVIGTLPNPPAELPWRTWFRQFLYTSRPLVRRYPGVARHIIRYGPAAPAALPIIDRGIQVLVRDGFGDHATVVYRYLLTTSFTLIAAEDDRDEHPAGWHTMAELLTENQARLPGLAAAAAAARERDEQWSNRHVPDDAFYEFTVERSLEGAAALIAAERD